MTHIAFCMFFASVSPGSVLPFALCLLPFVGDFQKHPG